MHRDGKEFKSGRVRRPAIVKLLREKSTVSMARHFFIIVRFVFSSIRISALVSSVLFYSCDQKTKSPYSEKSNPTIEIENQSTIHYAVGFDLLTYQNYKILHLFRHYNDNADTLSFVLKENGAEVASQFKSLIQIHVPLKNMALLHSSYLPFFSLCETTDHISAISEAKYVYDKDIYNAVKSGTLSEIGYGETLDLERLLELGISAVVTVGWPNVPNKSQQVLGELDVPVLIFSDWQETTLLGRLEWVKIVAALTGADELADHEFLEIEKRYNTLKSCVIDNSNQPDVICNLPYKGSWYMPGGDSYVSNVIKDAGANYLWSDEEGTGGLQIDFEAVYAKGIAADFWINPGSANTFEDIISNDERLKDFQSFKASNVYNSNNRVVRGIANDYWESAIVKPDMILADLIKIFHPDFLPGHELYYYKQIR